MNDNFGFQFPGDDAEEDICGGTVTDGGIGYVLHLPEGSLGHSSIEQSEDWVERRFRKVWRSNWSLRF